MKCSKCGKELGKGEVESVACSYWVPFVVTCVRCALDTTVESVQGTPVDTSKMLKTDEAFAAEIDHLWEKHTKPKDAFLFQTPMNPNGNIWAKHSKPLSLLQFAEKYASKLFPLSGPPVTLPANLSDCFKGSDKPFKI